MNELLGALLGGVTGGRTVVAAINPALRPPLLGESDCPVTRQVISEINLIARMRHEDAASGGVVNFMVAILLLVGVDHETRHLSAPQWLEHAG